MKFPIDDGNMNQDEVFLFLLTFCDTQTFCNHVSTAICLGNIFFSLCYSFFPRAKEGVSKTKTTFCAKCAGGRPGTGGVAPLTWLPFFLPLRPFFSLSMFFFHCLPVISLSIFSLSSFSASSRAFSSLYLPQRTAAKTDTAIWARKFAALKGPASFPWRSLFLILCTLPIGQRALDIWSGWSRRER